MPPWYYTLAHPEALFSPEERAAAIRGLEATFGRKGEAGSGREEGDD